MTLAELIQDPNWSEFRISGISEDSRIVQPGDAFIAVSQHPDQRLQHVQDAVKAGAAVILVPEAIDLQAPIPLVPVANLAAHRSEIAARYYQSPSQDLCCVGITGTNDKTSIA